MVCVGLIIFGAIYHKYGERLKTMVILLCTIVPILILAGLFSAICCVKKKMEEPDQDQAVVKEIDGFATRYEQCLLQFAQSFRVAQERGEAKSPMIRIFILIETLSIVKTIMGNVPHLLTEDSLKQLSDAFDQLEQSLGIDSKDLFVGVNDETDEMVNSVNMDLVFKIGMPLFYLGSPSVIDIIEIEDEINQISSDTNQPVDLVFQLVRNFKSVPQAMASWKQGRTEFETNDFGFLTAKLISEFKSSSIQASECHSLFTNFLVRPRDLAINQKLMSLEHLLNSRAHINVLFSVLPKDQGDIE